MSTGQTAGKTQRDTTHTASMVSHVRHAMHTRTSPERANSRSTQRSRTPTTTLSRQLEYRKGHTGEGKTNRVERQETVRQNNRGTNAPSNIEAQAETTTER